MIFLRISHFRARQTCLRELQAEFRANDWRVVTSSDSGVIRREALGERLYDVLPDRCVKCNARVTASVSKKRWSDSSWPTSDCFWCPAVFILYFMFRKTARVDFNICKAHVQKRTRPSCSPCCSCSQVWRSSYSALRSPRLDGLGRRTGIIASIVYG